MSLEIPGHLPASVPSPNPKGFGPRPLNRARTADVHTSVKSLTGQIEQIATKVSARAEVKDCSSITIVPITINSIKAIGSLANLMRNIARQFGGVSLSPRLKVKGDRFLPLTVDLAVKFWTDRQTLNESIEGISKEVSRLGKTLNQKSLPMALHVPGADASILELEQTHFANGNPTTKSNAKNCRGSIIVPITWNAIGVFKSWATLLPALNRRFGRVSISPLLGFYYSDTLGLAFDFNVAIEFSTTRQTLIENIEEIFEKTLEVGITLTQESMGVAIKTPAEDLLVLLPTNRSR